MEVTLIAVNLVTYNPTAVVILLDTRLVGTILGALDS